MERNAPLQVLRAIAASIVVYAHAATTYGEKVKHVHIDLNMDFGGLGVEIFFCISGFIIYKTTQNYSAGIGNSVNFLVKRIIRIFPIYAIATLVYAAKLYFEGDPPALQAIVKSLLFYPYIDNPQGQMRPVLGVGWSLNYEMLFYALLAVGLLIWRRYRVYFALCFLAGFLIYNTLLPTARTMNSGGYHLLATSWLGYFMIGMLLAHYARALEFRRLAMTDSLVAVLVTAILLAYVALYALVDINSPLSMVLGLGVSAVCIILCINTHHSETLHPILDLGVKAGDGSYSTYLFHSFLLGVSGRVFGMLNLTVGPHVFALLMVIAAAIMGVFIYTLLEKPMLNSLNTAWRTTQRRAFA